MADATSGAGAEWSADLDEALLEGLFSQSWVGLHVLDPQLRMLRFNTAAPGMRGIDPSDVVGRTLQELDFDPGPLEPMLRQVLATGEDAHDVLWHTVMPNRVGGERTLSLSAFRLQGTRGRTLGVALSVVDVTERQRAQDRLALLLRAGREVGSTLDVFRTAQELADAGAGGLADLVTVDVLDPVLQGQAPEPGGVVDRAAMRRAGVGRSATCDAQEALEVGEVALLRPGSPYAQAMADLRPRLVPRLSADAPWLEPYRAELVRQNGLHTMMAVPLVARGVVLGLVSFYGAESAEPFGDADLAVAADLTGQGAVSLDNARLYARESTLARMVRRSVLPTRAAASTAAEIASTYVPAAGGGAWYDVVPLSSARVALAVGDVSGHGMPAATTTGRLRTALTALALRDLQPDELLEHLHDLTGRLADERPDPAFPDQPPLTATCLVAVYDPATGSCALAAAGNPAPFVVGPDGAVRDLAVPTGPPLGLGVCSYSATDVELPPGTVLALHNAGLPRGRPAASEALARFRDELTSAGGGDTSGLQAACDVLAGSLLPEHARQDAVLLLARTRRLGSDQTASWSLPGVPESAAAARRLVAGQLHDWGLDELSHNTELVASELVTNAVLYASGPLTLRLIRDRGLTCEVTDDSRSAPHLRHAEDDDEGGRGLYIVGQLTEHWGTRRTTRSKTIWTEQPLPPTGPADRTG